MCTFVDSVFIIKRPMPSSMIGSHSLPAGRWLDGGSGWRGGGLTRDGVVFMMGRVELLLDIVGCDFWRIWRGSTAANNAGLRRDVDGCVVAKDFS